MQRAFLDFDLALIALILQQLGAQLDTMDVLDDPAMLRHHRVATMTKAERDQYRRRGGKVLSAFRSDLGLRHIAPSRGDGRGSRWEKSPA
jgi:hypothetical protein